MLTVSIQDVYCGHCRIHGETGNLIVSETESDSIHSLSQNHPVQINTDILIARSRVIGYSKYVQNILSITCN